MSQNPATAAVKPLKLTDDTFKTEVLESDVPVLVDFWAEWCGPCHMIAPSVEKMANEFAGQLKVTKLNIDEYPYFSNVYQVRGIPTLLLFKDGQVADQMVGAAPEPYLREFVQKNI